MKDEEGVSPVLILCFVVMLLAALCGGVIERAGWKGSPPWLIAIGITLLSGVAIGLHMIITRHAFFRNGEFTGKNAVAVGGLVVLIFGTAFLCIVLGALQ